MEVFYEEDSCYVARQTKSFPPFKFGAVCKSWRKIAWSTPRIWNAVHFVLDHRHGEKGDVDRRVELLEEYISRSGALSLTIETECDDDDAFEIDKKLSQQLVDVLISCLHRWHTVKLHFTPGMFLHMDQKVSTSPPPSLRSLHLSVINPGGKYDGKMTFMDWTSITSGLRKLVVESFDDLELDCLKVACASLEELQGCSSAKVLSRFLRAATLLHTAKIEIEDDDDDRPDQFGQPLVHKSLHQLEFSCMDGRNMSSILANLSCPNLRTFAIEDYSHGLCSSTLHQFLSRSPKLCELSVNDMGWTNPTLHRLFSALPHVKTLAFPGVTIAFMSKLLDVDNADFPLRVAFSNSLRILAFNEIRWEAKSRWDFLQSIPKHDFVEERRKASRHAGRSSSATLQDVHIKITVDASLVVDLKKLYLQPQHLQVVDSLNLARIKVDISFYRGYHNCRVHDLIALSKFRRVV